MDIQCEPQGITVHRHNQTCRKYVLCVNGKSEELECPIGQAFSERESNCVKEEYADCLVVGSNRPPAFCPFMREPNQISVVPNIRDCNSFYICTAGRTIPLFCAPNLQYDEQKKWCDKAETVNCKVKKVQNKYKNSVKLSLFAGTKSPKFPQTIGIKRLPTREQRIDLP